MKSKKGFTLVELIAVLIVLIIIVLMAIFAVNKIVERSKKKAFIKEANTFAKAALTKYHEDKDLKLKLRTDLYGGEVPGKVCYSITDNLLGRYVSVDNKKHDYSGSVEVCYGDGCTSQFKIWFTNGDKFYFNGETNIDSADQIEYSTNEEYFNSCGYESTGASVGTTKVAEFDYTGYEQRMTILKDGVYKLEAWGAQGGDYSQLYFGGYGSYSYVEVELKKGDVLYINVGQKGNGKCPHDDNTCVVSYNGGAKGGLYIAGGGGATSIATKSGLLTTVPDSNLYIVAGGGSGGDSSHRGSNAGGYTVEQTTSAKDYWGAMRGKFGYHGGYTNKINNQRGNGGGYSSKSCDDFLYNETNDKWWNFPVGGTGYVFHPKTSNGVMYCYSCPQQYASNSYGDKANIPFSTSRTIVNPEFSNDPEPHKSKIGNGYARISYLSGYQLTYKLDGGALADGVTNPTSYSEETSTITLNNPTKANYDFIGWNDGTNLFDASSTAYKANAYVTAAGVETDHAEYSIYQINVSPNSSYTIYNSGKSTGPGYAIFDSSGNYITGDGYRDRRTVSFTTPSNASFIRYSVVTQISSTRYDKKSFRLEKPNITQTIPSGSTGNKTFTARYKPSTYTITYDLNGGTLAEGVTNPTSYNYESASFTLNNPTKDGVTFKGWTGSNGETPQTSISINKGSTGNRTYTAVFE